MFSLFQRKPLPRHTNPDGSIGGVITDGSRISDDAFVGITAIIMPGAVVHSGQRVESGEILTPNGHIVRFSSDKL